MSRQNKMKKLICISVCLLVFTVAAVAQNQSPQDQQQAPPPPYAQEQPQAPPPYAQEQPSGPPPLTLQAGTVLIVRIDQALSSDHNYAGDGFSATLSQPVVAQGVVVAQRGQTVLGRVIDVKRAKGFSGTSQVQLALTRIILVDGQSLPINTQLVVSRGPSTTSRDVGTVGATTATGAVIGAVAGRGTGAVVGAGTGAAAGVIGVLATKGHETVVYPETQLIFQTTDPLTIDTSAAPQAFHAVDPAMYSRNLEQPAQRPVPARRPEPGAYPYPYPVYYGCDPFWYPYCYGPSVRVVYGGYGHWRHR